MVSEVNLTRSTLRIGVVAAAAIACAAPSPTPPVTQRTKTRSGNLPAVGGPNAHLFPGAPVKIPPPQTPAPLDLGSPSATVDSQLRLLSSRDFARFADTFTPDVRAQITPETFADCRAYVTGHSVVANWDAAELSNGPPGQVVRASIFGRSTGFHQLGGRWLADAVWCRPW